MEHMDVLRIFMSQSRKLNIPRVGWKVWMVFCLVSPGSCTCCTERRHHGCRLAGARDSSRVA